MASSLLTIPINVLSLHLNKNSNLALPAICSVVKLILWNIVILSRLWNEKLLWESIHEQNYEIWRNFWWKWKCRRKYGCNFRKYFNAIVSRLKGLSIELTSRKVNSLEQPPTHVGTELYSQQGVPRRFWLLSSRNAIKKCLQDNNSILVFKFLSYFVKISTFLVWIVINKKAAFKIWIDSYTLTKELFNFYKEYLNQESQFNRSNIIVYKKQLIVLATVPYQNA